MIIKLIVQASTFSCYTLPSSPNLYSLRRLKSPFKNEKSQRFEVDFCFHLLFLIRSITSKK